MCNVSALDTSRPEVHAFVEKMVKDHHFKRIDVDAILKMRKHSNLFLTPSVNPPKKPYRGLNIVIALSLTIVFKKV